MRKDVFLSALQEELEEHGFVKQDRHDILEDYQATIEEAMERGEDETTFIEKLGKPRDIVKELKKTHKRVEPKAEKLIALSPFVALIAFFLLGLGFNLWHPGWLVFLLIPMTAIALETKNSERFIALTPFVITVVFILLGTYLGLWQPLWSLYVLIFAVALFVSDSRALRALSFVPVLSVIAFITLSLLYPDWNPWLTALVFVPVVPLAYISGVIQISVKKDGVPQSWREILAFKSFWIGLGLLTLSGLVYLGLAFVTELWHPTWLVFLTVPVGLMLYAKLKTNEEIPLVAFMPFIALTIFFLVGHFLNGYAYSWLAFLLIPITAILTNES